MTQYWNVKDQIDTIEMLATKLRYGVNDRDQLCNLPIMVFFYKNTKTSFTQDIVKGLTWDFKWFFMNEIYIFKSLKFWSKKTKIQKYQFFKIFN